MIDCSLIKNRNVYIITIKLCNLRVFRNFFSNTENSEMLFAISRLNFKFEAYHPRPPVKEFPVFWFLTSSGLTTWT